MKIRVHHLLPLAVGKAFATAHRQVKLPLAAGLLAWAWQAAIILFATALAYGQALPPVDIAPGGPAYAPGEVLVQFKADVTDPQLTGAFQQAGLGLIKHIQTPTMRDHGRIGITRASTAMPVPTAVRILNNRPGVEFAEPNWVATQDDESNDPYYWDLSLPGPLWGMYGDDSPAPIGPVGTTNPFGSQAEKAWAAGFIGSPDVFVGIIDGGIQTDHPDLAANIWTNPGEIPGNGIDDDGNGYVDDLHGWNAIDDNGDVSNPDNSESHGSHVAGTIGAIGGNGLGVAGVNWNVTMISGKCLYGPTPYSVIIEAIDYMTSLKTSKGLNIVALNHSWSGGGFSQALLDSINRAAQAGILSVAAAANSSSDNDSSPVYPACFDTTPSAGYDAVIAVAAINRDGQKSSFSNYGRTTVDLGAPGGELKDLNDLLVRDPDYEIVSTVPPSTYGHKRGTSMAAPHVTGAVALYAAAYPGATPQQIRYDLLTAGSRPLPALTGITATGGTLDTWTFIDAPVSGNPRPVALPNAPSGLTASALSPGKGVALSWKDNSTNEDGFKIERKTGTSTTWQIVATVTGNTTKFTDASAPRRATLTYRVRAFNVAGSSAYSNERSVKTK